MPRSRARKTQAYAPTRGLFAGQRFRSKGDYRTALAQSRRPKAIRTRKDLEALSHIEQEKRSDALEVLNLMRRERLPLRRGVRAFKAENQGSRLTDRSALRYIKPALRKRKGKWGARSSDRLIRVMRFPTRGGIAEIEIRDSRQASKIGEFWNAVKDFLNTGSKKELRQFRGKEIKVGGKTYKFLTGPKALEQLAEFDAFDIDSIYERTGAR